MKCGQGLLSAGNDPGMTHQGPCREVREDMSLKKRKPKSHVNDGVQREKESELRGAEGGWGWTRV